MCISKRTVFNIADRAASCLPSRIETVLPESDPHRADADVSVDVVGRSLPAAAPISSFRGFAVVIGELLKSELHPEVAAEKGTLPAFRVLELFRTQIHCVSKVRKHQVHVRQVRSFKVRARQIRAREVGSD